jgi:hydrogenase nickel incorporation protein HypA/HybF
MHELAIVDSMIEQVRAELLRAGAEGRVTRIDLAIGRLSGVSPDAVRFGFQVLARDTELESAEIVIREPKARCACRACLATTELDRFDGCCPRCASPEIQIEGGRDLLLESIELEEA